jgi:hypothetical protein
MIKVLKFFTFTLFILLTSAAAVQAQVRVMADSVTDTRRSDGFFSKLEIKLKLIGDGLSDARAMRMKVARAVDETGKDLIPEKDREDKFEEIGSAGDGSPKFDLELKNPARRATVVEEISGS